MLAKQTLPPHIETIPLDDCHPSLVLRMTARIQDDIQVLIMPVGH